MTTAGYSDPWALWMVVAYAEHQAVELARIVGRRRVRRTPRPAARLPDRPSGRSRCRRCRPPCRSRSRSASPCRPRPNTEPNRSMRTGPGGFSAFCSSRLSVRAPDAPRFIGQSTCTSRIGVEAEALRDARRDERDDARQRLVGLVARDEVEVAPPRLPGSCRASRRR